MNLKELNSDLLNLKRDYDCCDTPKWNDPATQRSLDRIVYEIKLGRLSLSDFNSFVEANLGNGDFAWGCLIYVRNNL